MAPRSPHKSRLSEHAPEACPAAALAAPLAEAIRVKRRLHSDAALIERLNSDDNSPGSDELGQVLSERIQAFAHMASQRRARSQRGALLQVFVALHAADNVNDSSVWFTEFHVSDTRRIRSAERALVRLLYSAARAVAPAELDDDLRTIREWFAPEGFDDLALIDALASEHR